MSYVGASHSYVNGTQFNLAQISGVADGDLIILMTYRNGNTSQLSDLCGFNEICTFGTTHHNRYYYKIANSEPSSGYGLSWSGTAVTRAVIVAFRDGFNQSDVIDSFSNYAYSTSNTTLRASTIDVTAPNSTLIFLGSVYATSSISSTPPTSPGTFTEHFENYSSGADVLFNVSSTVWSSSGNTTTESDATLSASVGTGKHAVLIALNPEPQGFDAAGKSVAVTLGSANWGGGFGAQAVGKNIAVTLGSVQWSGKNLFKATGKNIAVTLGSAEAGLSSYGFQAVGKNIAVTLGSVQWSGKSLFNAVGKNVAVTLGSANWGGGFGAQAVGKNIAVTLGSANLGQGFSAIGKNIGVNLGSADWYQPDQVIIDSVNSGQNLIPGSSSIAIIGRNLGSSVFLSNSPLYPIDAVPQKVLHSFSTMVIFDFVQSTLNIGTLYLFVSNGVTVNAPFPVVLAPESMPASTVAHDAAETLPSQFAESALTKGFLEAILSPFDEIDSACQYLNNSASFLHGAAGTWLDSEGKIIGAKRDAFSTPENLFFTFAGPREGASVQKSYTQGFDCGYLRSVFGNELQGTKAGDTDYTTSLKAKALATFRGTSLCDVVDFVYDLFGIICRADFSLDSDVVLTFDEKILWSQKNIIQKYAPVSAGANITIVEL